MVRRYGGSWAARGREGRECKGNVATGCRFNDVAKAAAKEACRLAVPRARCRSPSAGKDDDVRRCSTIAFGAKTSEAIRTCGLTWNAWQAGGRRYLGSRSLVCVCVHVTYAARMYRTYIREVPTSMFPPQRTHARSRIVSSTWDRREMRKPPPHRHHHLHLHHHHHHRRRHSSPCMRGLFSPSVGVGQQPRADDDDDDAVHRRDSAGSTCVSHLCPLSLPLSLSLSPSLPLLLFLSISLSLCLSLDRCHQQEKSHRRVAPLRHVA